MPDAPGRPSFYDGPGVAAAYGRHRHDGFSSPNNVMEEPAFLAAVGDVAGLRIVDLGCGDAGFGRAALGSGCRSYLGVDDSAAMVDRARSTLAGTAGQVRQESAEAVRLPSGGADLVVSRLALHYVEDLVPVLRSVRAWLSGGGRLVVTVLHPVLTSPLTPTSTGAPRTDWTIDDYFTPGPRRRSWMGSQVTWFHRTTEEYLDLLAGTGFSLTALRECAPDPNRFPSGDHEELARRRRVPMFLLLAATCGGGGAGCGSSAP